MPDSVPPPGAPYLPSHLNSNSSRCSRVAPSRHSPLQLPFKGCPNCASAGTCDRQACQKANKAKAFCLHEFSSSYLPTKVNLSMTKTDCEILAPVSPKDEYGFRPTGALPSLAFLTWILIGNAAYT